MPLQIGQPAPDFKLYDTEKKEVSLSDYRGRPVVLLFFPFAFTSVCTAELCSVRDEIAEYNEVDAVVFGISVDYLQTLKKYKAEQNLNFSLLSDFNKNVSADYDCLYEVFGQNMRGVSKRSSFVIDREGIMRFAQILENAGEFPDLPGVKACLQSL